jgi:hypothetical protein
MCRIVYEPDVLEVVPVELIQKIGTPPEEKPAATNGKYDPWTSVVSNGPGLTAYLKRAIESECLKVALAVADRNNQLNKSAFALGQFAGWPEMNEREAKATLQLAAERAGLLDREIIKTIASGWEAGTKEPRVRPQEPYILIPRLMELGADRSKIGFMKWAAMASYQLSDTDYLQEAWEERSKPELIVIDPPANFLGGKDEHKNAEIRSVLMKLVEWLENKPVGMALITHYNKGGAQKALDALDRIMGSVAWSSSARVACGFVANPDEQDRCIFGGIKNNLGPKAEPLSYTIRKTDSLATVDWFGKSKTSFDDAMGRTRKKSRAENATEWLVERFRERRSWPSDDLYDLGRTAGVSRSALWEAAETLPIKREHISPQDGGKRFWQWTARPVWPPVEILETVEILSSNSNQDKNIESVSILDEERNAKPAAETDVNKSSESVSRIPSVSVISKEESPIPKPEGWPDAWEYTSGAGKKKGDAPF